MIQQAPTDQLISNIGNIEAGNSFLFLFTSREMKDHYKRPLTYNFNPSMLNTISDKIMNRPTMAPIDHIINDPCMSTAILPSSLGEHVGTSAYSSNWTFVIIIDENVLAGGFTSNTVTNRHILIGICMDEPISPQGIHSATPEAYLNPTCSLVITRKMVINRYVTAGVSGHTSNMKVVDDTNIANYHDGIWGTNEFHSLSPSKTIGSIITDTDGMTSIIDSGESLNCRRSIDITSSMESPKKHLKNILVGLDSANQQYMFMNELGDYGNDSVTLNDPSESFRDEAITQIANLDSRSNSPSTSGVSSLVDSGYVTIGMIRTNYHPKLLVIETPVQTQADVIPQHETSINNIYSSLVCACLPSYINSVGLSSVSFMYNSSAEAIQLIHIESVIATTQDDLNRRWNALKFILNNELFGMLLQNGHFDMQATCNINSTTNVVLNFLDFTLLPDGAIYEENTILGGIVSPLIGTKDNVINNSHQLSHLIQNVADMTEYSY